MAQKQLVLSFLHSPTPLPRIIADNLDCTVVEHEAHGIGLLRLVWTASKASRVLILPKSGLAERLAARLFRLRHTDGKVLFLDSHMLSDAPADAELSAWVNTTLLPRMGFQPLGVAYFR